MKSFNEIIAKEIEEITEKLKTSLPTKERNYLLSCLRIKLIMQNINKKWIKTISHLSLDGFFFI